MAVRVLSMVWDGYPGGGTELLALLALADWSDDNGRCWPSMASIARKTRLSEKQARRVVHSVIKSGYLTVTANPQGGATSRRYQINLKRLATPPTHGSRTVIDTSITVKGKHTGKTISRKPPITEDFTVSERVMTWAKGKGFDRLEEHLEAFKAKCAANGYTYVDHDAAFMEAIRCDWAKLGKSTTAHAIDSAFRGCV